MRLRPIQIKLHEHSIGLEVPEGAEKAPFCIVFGAGKAKIMDLPSHGETKIITHQGKVKRIRTEEGEDF